MTSDWTWDSLWKEVPSLVLSVAEEGTFYSVWLACDRGQTLCNRRNVEIPGFVFFRLYST